MRAQDQRDDGSDDGTQDRCPGRAPVALGTWLQSWWPGSRLSRAIDQMIRLLVVMMIMPQANIETQTKIRKIFCTGPLRTSCTISATGAELALAALTELVA